MIDPKEILRRRDMRDVFTFTIDPADAKDFDDALSFEPLTDDTCQIGVHIADVSHYVKPGTAIDDEAYQRGTSTTSGGLWAISSQYVHSIFSRSNVLTGLDR